MTKKAIINWVGQSADHCFRWGSSQWDLPTEETYKQLCELPLAKPFLRQEYEKLRYTFNNQKSHHSVWDYDLATRVGHITPKPVALIKNIILHSSNEGDIVLDCFMGSGTTAVAAIETGRNFIGIEREHEYVEIANERIRQAQLESEAIVVNAHDTHISSSKQSNESVEQLSLF
jgi:site-specific DNA-methyltransferase (adenine-specific)